MYAMDANGVRSISRRMLEHTWGKIFKRNTLSEVLMPRYTSHIQPLVEFHQSSNPKHKTFEMIQLRFFRRVTIATYILTGANLIFLSEMIRRQWKRVCVPRLIFM
jgi:hypothetical protein